MDRSTILRSSTGQERSEDWWYQVLLFAVDEGVLPPSDHLAFLWLNVADGVGLMRDQLVDLCVGPEGYGIVR